MSWNRVQRDTAGRRLAAAVVALLLVAANAHLFAQSRIAVAIPAPTSPPAKTAADHRDVVVLLDDGPLLMRLDLALGGNSLVEARKTYVAELIQRLDEDKDGKLTRKEADRSPILRQKQRKSATGFLETLRAPKTLTLPEVAQKVDAAGKETVVYRQEDESSKSDVEVFKLFDADKNNILDASELGAAAELIMSKDNDGDQCVAFEEFLPPPPQVDPMQAALAQLNPPPINVARLAELLRDTRDPLLPQRLLKKYDKNRDFALDTRELGWTAERVAALDADVNKRLDSRELAALGSAPADLEMAVDLKPAGSEGGVMVVKAFSGKRLDDQGRPDYVKLALGTAVVTFSHRNVDTVAASIENALQQFNTMDADANGYLSPDEVAELTYVRGRFEFMDADGDEKVFADEMKEYVRAHAEPVAATCRVGLYDTGNGFFMALDANADGRISEREKRQSQKSLAGLERDGQAGVSQAEPVRHFHIEFARGSYQLFGPSEQLVSQTPAFQQRMPTGPIWFQRMDRNNDGDLTWNEFLGPREIYHELDGDHDDLLDPQEAVKAQ